MPTDPDERAHIAAVAANEIEKASIVIAAKHGLTYAERIEALTQCLAGATKWELRRERGKL